MEQFRPSTKKLQSRCYQAVLKNSSGKVVWECLHCHTNRDQSTYTNGESAIHCAKQALIEEHYGLGMNGRSVTRIAKRREHLTRKWNPSKAEAEELNEIETALKNTRPHF